MTPQLRTLPWDKHPRPHSLQGQNCLDARLSYHQDNTYTHRPMETLYIDQWDKVDIGPSERWTVQHCPIFRDRIRPPVCMRRQRSTLVGNTCLVHSQHRPHIDGPDTSCSRPRIVPCHTQVHPTYHRLSYTIYMCLYRCTCTAALNNTDQEYRECWYAVTNSVGWESNVPYGY